MTDVPAASTGRADLVDALLVASRAMIAIASRSLAETDQDVTLAQSRALVLLASHGPLRGIDIAADLGVAPSTATRMCDRLLRKGLLERSRATPDRREVRVTLSDTGRELVREISHRRREVLDRVVDALPPDTHAQVAAALHTLNEAAGEVPDREWWLSPDEA